MRGTSEFGATLRRFRLRRNLSSNSMAQRASVNASYVQRIEQGVRAAPSVELLGALVEPLRLTSQEEDLLYYQAGYVPPVLVRLGWDDDLGQVLHQLLAMSPERREIFLGGILALGQLTRPEKPKPVAEIVVWPLPTEQAV